MACVLVFKLSLLVNTRGNIVWHHSAMKFVGSYSKSEFFILTPCTFIFSKEIEEEEDEGLSPARGNNNNRGGRGYSGGVGSGGGGNMYYNARK